MGSRQAYQPIAKILPLQQDKNYENNDNAGGRQRRYQWRDQGPQVFQGARIRLAYLDWNGRDGF